MNCKDFQTRLLQDPSCEEDDFVAHAKSCRSCAEKWQQAQEFEAILRVAIEVQPETAIDIAKPDASLKKWWQSPAARAFSVLLLMGAVVLGINFAQQKLVTNDLPQLVIHHIGKEPELLESPVVLNQLTLRHVLSPMKFELSGVPAEVTAAVPCWIRQGRGMHLVVQGQQGPVTVLLMPGEFVQKPQIVKRASLSGVIVPVQWGSMAVISHAGDDVARLTDALQHGVRWKGITASADF
jgi:hypothetical protein